MIPKHARKTRRIATGVLALGLVAAFTIPAIGGPKPKVEKAAPAPSAAPAPGPSAGGHPQLPPDAAAKMAELQQLDQKLQAIRDTAMKDPALEKDLAALKASIDKAMEQSGPDVAKKTARFRALTTELQAAEAKNDTDKASKLLPEVRELATSLQAAQSEVMKRKDITDQVKSFESRLVAKMKTVDPEAEKMMKRVDTLTADLRAHFGG